MKKFRLKDFLKDNGLKQNDAALFFNCRQSNISMIINQGKDLEPHQYEAMYSKFDREMVDSYIEIEGAGNNMREPEIGYLNGKPYYDVDFVGGFDLVLNDTTTKPQYLINFRKYNDADCWCNVTGHSMEPEIHSGDIIALKEVSNWNEFLLFGEVYGIITDDFRTIKRVTGSDRDGFLRLIPTNRSEEFQPQDIPKSMITRVYKVLGCMKKL